MFKINLKLVLVSLVVFFGSLGAYAYEKEFDLKNISVSSRNPNISLNQQIKQEYGRTDLQNMTIKRIQVIARDADRNSRVRLMVAGERVGTSYFDRRGARGNRLVATINNQNNRSNGRWQLQVSGHAEIVRIRVIVEESYRRPTPPDRPGRGDGNWNPGRGGQLISYGVTRAEKIRTTKTYSINSNVNQLVIKVSKKGLNVMAARVFYSNGQSEELYSLQGWYNEGMQKSQYLSSRGGYVTHVEIQAQSALIGSRGKFELLAQQESGRRR